MEEKYFLAALGEVSGLGSVTLKKLIDRTGGAKNAWRASANELAASGVLSRPVIEALEAFRKKRPNAAEETAELCAKKHIGICSIYDDDYPLLLREIARPPTFFYFRGEILPDALGIAVVGSRNATEYGIKAARRMARELAASGILVVSGAARGIDSAAHEGALVAGKTVAVLGCGVDVAYPAANKKLLDRIAENGAIISEYPPGTSPLAAHFPARNRIICGLSKGTVVVEAAKKSGALITATLALESGRDVFAVPGAIDSAMSSGANHLIQQGAKLVTSVADILEEYGIFPDDTAKKYAAAKTERDPAPREESLFPASDEETRLDDAPNDDDANEETSREDAPNDDDGREEKKFDEQALTGDEKKIYDLLVSRKSIANDEIVNELGSEPQAVAFALLQMQLKNIVVQDGGIVRLRVERE